jgi:hypothetical protein
MEKWGKTNGKSIYIRSNNMSNKRISVMISSRCDDTFVKNDRDSKLSSVRKELKKQIEETILFGHQLFDVWINEDSPPLPGDKDSWEHCMKQARDCNIFICLYNGNAGWKCEEYGLGICHAELETAMNITPGKVRLIELPFKKEESEHFRRYIERLNLFQKKLLDGDKERLEKASFEEAYNSLFNAIVEALFDSVVALSHAGVREASKGRYHLGEALDWTRMSYGDRIKAMTDAGHTFMEKQESLSLGDNMYDTKIGTNHVLVHMQAIPDALSISKARESVGQSFLNDHERLRDMKEKVFGPLHIILCYKTITENQVRSIIGYPDIEVVKAPFGIFAAEEIYKVQIAFIINCRDQTTTRHGLLRFIEWIKQSQESEWITKRAISRKKILKAIAKEI